MRSWTFLLVHRVGLVTLALQHVETDLEDLQASGDTQRRHSETEEVEDQLPHQAEHGDDGERQGQRSKGHRTPPGRPKCGPASLALSHARLVIGQRHSVVATSQASRPPCLRSCATTQMMSAVPMV
jgi:hypothetical protein